MVNNPHANEEFVQVVLAAYLEEHHKEYRHLEGEEEDAPHNHIFGYNAPCVLEGVLVYPTLEPSIRAIPEKESHAHCRHVTPERDDHHSRTLSTVYLAVDEVGVPQGCGQSPSSDRPSLPVHYQRDTAWSVLMPETASLKKV